MGIILPDFFAGVNKHIKPCETEIMNTLEGDMIMASINKMQSGSQSHSPDTHILNIREPICQGIFTNKIKHCNTK